MLGGGGRPGQEAREQAGWLVSWIVVYGLVASGLLLATLGTFNRCLGRIDESPTGTGRFLGPARKPAASPPEEVSALNLGPCQAEPTGGQPASGR